MQLTEAFFATACQMGGRFALGALARDSLHLSPTDVSRAAKRRLKQAIAALTAYVRRLVLLLALSLEPHLQPRLTPRPIYARTGQRHRAETRLKILPDRGNGTAFFLQMQARQDGFPRHRVDPELNPLLHRIETLRVLLDNPMPRARRLAWHLARQLPGPILAVDHGTALPNRYGTGFTATHKGMGRGLIVLSRQRPPSIGPPPRMPPRIRTL